MRQKGRWLTTCLGLRAARVRALTALLSLSLVVPGCGGGSSASPSALPPDTLLVLNAPPATDDSFTSTTPVATTSSGSIVPLFGIPSIATNQGLLSLTAWGTKDAGGDLVAVQEMAISGIAPTGGTVYAAFDATQRPVLFVDAATGVSMLIVYNSPASLTVTVCDPQGGATTITETPDSAGYPQGSPMDGGSCVPAGATSVADASLATAPGATVSSGGSGVATNVQEATAKLAARITEGAYINGFADAVGAILKFKQHKDNPTQVPIGIPVSLIFVAASLLFLPSILNVLSVTTVPTSPAAYLSLPAV